MAAIRIASSDALSTFYSQAEDLGRILVEEGVVDHVEVLETTGSVMNAKMVGGGEADIGFMASNWVPRAVNGNDPFDRPVPVSVISPLNAGPLFFATRADSSLRSVADLKGRRVAVGHRDSGMAQHALNFLRCWGWGEDGVDLVFNSTFDGGTALADGDVDAQFQAPIPNAHFKDLCDTTPIRVLDYPKSLIDAACDAFPFYFPTLVPSEHVPQMTEDTKAIGVLNVMVAAEDFPAEKIRPLVAAFIRRAQDLSLANGLFRGLDGLLRNTAAKGEADMIPGGLGLHPGALSAFRAAGLFPESK